MKPEARKGLIAGIIVLSIIFPSVAYPQSGNTQRFSLSPGDNAEVTGDYVRIRTGPTLEYRILTKVNRGTKVKVIEKSKEKMKINSMEDYWYKVKLVEKEITGWIYGGFLKKTEKGPVSGFEKAPGIKLTLIPPVSRKSIPYRNIGRIKTTARIITTGDLNGNKKGEIIFLEESKRETILRGFESDNSNIEEVYSVGIKLSGVNYIHIYNFENIPPILAIKNKVSSFLFLYNKDNKNFKLLKRINSEKIAIGEFGEGNFFYLSTSQNRRRDNDGTVTYFLALTPFHIKNRRIIAEKPMKYSSPLPVKKLLTIDVDGDKVSEIIAEIGGKDMGGGLVLLKIKNGTISRIQNTGFPTYNDGEFLSMWGCTLKNNSPYLFIYSEEPENAYTANPFMGIIVSQFKNGRIKYSNFLPLNRMLEDINNYRTVIPVTYVSESSGLKNVYFYIVDFSPESKEYIIKRLEPQS